MTDNPFSESDDSDRTIIRPAPGGRRPAAPSAGAPTPADVNPFATGPARPPASSISEGPSAPAVLVAEAPETIDMGGSPLLTAASPLLQLLARLRNTASQPNAGELRERAVQEVRKFEQAGLAANIPLEQMKFAHYALCASIDDVVMDTPWGAEGIWSQYSLGSTFHRDVRSGERFFDLLRQLQQNPGATLPVLELMYICLSLGYMGGYRLRQTAAPKLTACGRMPTVRSSAAAAPSKPGSRRIGKASMPPTARTVSASPSGWPPSPLWACWRCSTGFSPSPWAARRTLPSRRKSPRHRLPCPASTAPSRRPRRWNPRRAHPAYWTG